MQRGKFLHTEKIKGHQTNGHDVDLSVYGIFMTNLVKWKYYVISYCTLPGNSYKLTTDVCSCSYIMEATYENIERFGKEFKTKEEGVKFIHDYKIKWETGSNNTTEEMRDKKLDDLLDK